MNTEPVIIERVYNAPIEMVWQAITDKERMKQWYFDIADFKPEEGCEFSFIGTDGDCVEYVHLCTVKEVIPNKKLVYSWRYQGYDGDSLVTFELFDEDGKTRLKLTHTGLNTFPAQKAFNRENFLMGWTQIIGTSLKDYSETAARQIMISRLLKAPRELVFKVWTDPEHIKHWWGPDGFTNTIQEMDVRAGGNWDLIMHGPDGTNYKNHSVYTEVVAQEKLVYRHYNPNFVMTVTFEEKGIETLLTMSMLFDTPEQKQQTVKVFRADEGIVQNMTRLEEYLAAL